MTERLPLGILLQDSDFLGEDPLRDGASALRVLLGGGTLSSEEAPLRGSSETGRIQGAGQIGMADGGILRYAPWTVVDPTGTKKFRLYRGGGSLYTLEPGKQGGPVDFSAGGFPEGCEPVLKGFVLAGRAFLVRNYLEEAFAGGVVRSHGDELQMVVVTAGVPGQGPESEAGYALQGQISPTGYGEGFAAADRYRLEGLPLMVEHNRAQVLPNIEGDLAPYPGKDPEPPGPC
jgi:hypothetical protein